MSDSPDIQIDELTDPQQIGEFADLLAKILGTRCGDLITIREAVLCGGYCLAVRVDSELIGGAWGMPGIDSHGTFLQVVGGGVIPKYQNTGVGERIFMQQLDIRQRRGIKRFRFTFDPLNFSRAHFFVNKGQCLVDRYIPDCYGSLDGVLGSATSQPTPSDRFQATIFSDLAVRSKIEDEETLVTVTKPSEDPDGPTVTESLNALRTDLKPLLDQGSVVTRVEGDATTITYRTAKAVG